ncbi:MAG: hypothetical protein L0271_12890 [Gemmatimonadetes bacterium]|nr:hypothetical protein [Gemmatimonadota bacterium]
MSHLFRRVRGALGLAATWGLVWGAIFAILGVIVGIVDPGSIDAGEGPIRIAGIGAIFGLVSGAVFGVVLSLAERGKSIPELSLKRVALWGALATAVYPLLTPVDNGMLFFLCPIGAALAAGLVAAAKKAELTASQRRELPG